MTRLKKKRLHRSNPKAFSSLVQMHMYDCSCAGRTLASAHTYTDMHAHPQTRTLWKEIKCFNQLATVHNEDPLSHSYQLPSATYLCFQRADFSLLLQPA